MKHTDEDHRGQRSRRSSGSAAERLVLVDHRRVARAESHSISDHDDRHDQPAEREKVITHAPSTVAIEIRRDRRPSVAYVMWPPSS